MSSTRQLEQAKGSISMRQLEKITGYGNRRLNLKFKERPGITTKSFGSIIRFQHYYKLITGKPNKHNFARLRHYPYYMTSLK